MLLMATLFKIYPLTLRLSANAGYKGQSPGGHDGLSHRKHENCQAIYRRQVRRVAAVMDGGVYHHSVELLPTPEQGLGRLNQNALALLR